MGKQTRSKKTDPLGQGKVTPVQIAFIVDRYLCDNNFSETRSVFRNEASLIAKSPVNEAPKSLLSLGTILNEYIVLKEQKVMVDHEKARLEQEKFRVQTLLRGMQDVLNAYTASATPSTTLIQASSTKPPAIALPPPDLCAGSSAGAPIYKSPNVMPVSVPSNTIMEHSCIGSTSSTNPLLTRKRAGATVAAEAPLAAKKSRGKSTAVKMPSKGSDKQGENAASNQEAAPSSAIASSSPHHHAQNGSLAQGSGVAKSLFNPTSLSPPTSSSGPNTPQQAIFIQNDKYVSPVGNSSLGHCNNNNTPRDVTPSNCTIITTERVMVSPCKQMAYYSMERNHCISSSSPVRLTPKRLNKRDCVKGRLDFDNSEAATSLDKPSPTVDPISASESDKEADLFDIDLPNLDAFGPNFSFSDLLVDLDFDCEGIGCPSKPMLAGSTDTLSGSSHESRDGNLGADQVLSEFSSAATEMISGKDLNMQGPDNTLTTVKSITKCIRILSPVKNHKSSCA